MGTAYIDCTIDAELNGVCLFQAECVAEVEYEVDAGALSDWRIHDFKFESYRAELDYKGNVFNRRKSGEVPCPDSLRPALMEFVDKAKLEEDLIDHLMDTGEMYFQGEGQRRGYNSAVL